MDGLFQLGDFCFRLTCPEALVPPPNFRIFQVPQGEPEYRYTIALTDRLTEPEGERIAERADIKIFSSGALESRLIGVKGREEPYACYREVAPDRAEVQLLAEEIRQMHIDPMFSSLLALERRLVWKDALILHCAYIRYKDEAILFSAPSETGKTTQANLWEQYRGSVTVNGDKSLLQRVNGRWTAQGWPVCGTSEICNNLSTPIKAIVMLSQGKEDTVRRLTPVEAFSQLYGQITTNTWNREAVRHNMGLIEQLITQTPVFHLRCTISETAVRRLEAALYPGQEQRNAES